jgi:uncharacterized protein (TIGR02246 family)
MRRTAFALLFAAVCCAQTRLPGLQDLAENLDFSAGDSGQMPPGWNLGGPSSYEAVTAADASCHGTKQCGNVRSIGVGPHGFCFLYQIIDAEPHRGKWVSFRAAVRMTGNGSARLLVRIHRNDGSTSFRDDMGDHPIAAGPWAFYEIDAPLPADARDIEFGMQLHDEGSATIDNISLDFDSVSRKENEAAVRALIKKFADLRNAHDGAAVAALYSEDGEWSTADGDYTRRGRPALTALWNSVTGQVERSIDFLDLETPTIAVVHTKAKYTVPQHLSHEVFVLVRDQGNWYIRVHQIID